MKMMARRRGGDDLGSRFWVALVLSLLGALCAAAAGALTPEEIPSPRPAGWTVDLTGTLPPAVRAEIDRVAEAVRTEGKGELAVVVVGSIGGSDPRKFATRLANLWGVGSAKKDDGVLLFAALDDRAAEIVLGTGIDGPVGERVSQQIMDREMLPRFRAGDPAGALLAGATACARRLLGVTLAGGEGGPAEVEAKAATAPPAAQRLFEAPKPAEAPAAAFEPTPQVPEESGWSLLPAVLPGLLLGGGLLGGITAALVLALRPQRCSTCKVELRLLDEQADDAHLNPGEKSEERVGSVDYRIRVCPGCGELSKAAGRRWFSGFAKCPQCAARTLSQKETVLEAATYSSGGRIRIDRSCAHCAHSDSTVRHTPRLQRSTSNSSRSRSAWSGSSSSRSSGFGGGSSRGGGASGRW
jgi:uncharacterized protein